MAEPFIAEIRLMSFSFPPRGWALCNGQLLPINQNQALFSLLGTTYGGDGRVNFALPNLQGRVPIHTANGHTLGEMGGELAHTLTMTELPQHTHNVAAYDGVATSAIPGPTAYLAGQSGNPYGTVPSPALTGPAPSSIGGGQAHLNMQPFLTLSYCIALQGIFPSQT